MPRSIPRDIELDKQLRKLIELDHTIRAKFLVQTIYIDAFLGGVISKYFVSDKKREELFYYLMSKEFSFNQKIRIIQEIFRPSPQIVKKYPKYNNETLSSTQNLTLNPI